MNAEVLRTLLLAQPAATTDHPFGPQPLVLKVAGKMFALLSEDAQPMLLSLKCDPYHGQMLREEYAAIAAGYHLDKRHWITITLDGSVPDDVVRGALDESYALVVQGLTRAQRQQIAQAGAG